MNVTTLEQIARDRYYGSGVTLVADNKTQVVRPANYVDPSGCVAIRITVHGGWEEGWWSPSLPFRAFGESNRNREPR